MEYSILVAIGGGLGAAIRFGIAELMEDRHVPVSTLVVNVLGSFLLGVVLFGELDESTVQLLGAGVCGALTTFSTFSYQVVTLAGESQQKSVAYAVGTLGLALAAFGFGALLVVLDLDAVKGVVETILADVV